MVATCRRGCRSATKEQCASPQLEPSIRGWEVNVAASHERQVSDPLPRHFGPRADVRLWRRGRPAGGRSVKQPPRGTLADVKSEFGSRFIAGLGKVLPDEELADGRQLDRLRRVL